MNKNQQFQQVIIPKVPRSRQDLSHSKKFTHDFGYLIPDLLIEVLPGDAMRGKTDVFMRMQPMKFPVMHDVEVYQHFFYVPWFQIWNHWPKFLIPQKDEGDGEGQTPIPLPPYFTPSTAVGNKLALFQKNSLWDYIGLPPISELTDFPSSPTSDVRIQIAPFIAYQLIYNEYYRDQNLVPEIDLEFWKDRDGSASYGADTDVNDALTQLFQLRRRAWEKDLFTSSLPFPQKGNPAGINLNLGDAAADVVLKQAALQSAVTQRLVKSDLDPVPQKVLGSNVQDLTYGQITENGYLPDNYAYLDPHGTMEAKLDNINAAFSIEDLRVAERSQEWSELLARAGSRDTEVIRSNFGVIPDDLRIGRPQYLGGGKQNIVISEVLQQSQSTEDSALGDFAGHGLSVGSANFWKGFFTYWGFVIGILSVRPRSAYGQGVQKLFTKFDRYEYFWSAFSHLGEQPVKNGELYFDYKDGKNDQEFGYQPIYHDYRYIASTLAGEMRDTLADWHLNRIFSSRPSLNKDFIEIDPADMYHIFAVTDAAAGQHLVTEVYHTIKAVRPVPKYGNPTL